jgi:hypothetical protein
VIEAERGNCLLRGAPDRGDTVTVMLPLSACVRISACMAILIAGTWPSRAGAETAVLLSPKGDEAIERERMAAQQALLDVLTAQGVRVRSQDDARECSAVDCAKTLLHAKGGDVAVVLAVWAAGEPAAPATVFVTLVDRAGDRYPGKARVEGGGAGELVRAVEDALLDARALQLLGRGPWLRVRGEPEGAEVLLDGKLVGTVPFRAPIDSGRHTLEVRFEGRRPHVQTVDVPPSTARQVELEVALPDRSAPPVAAAARDEDARGRNGGSRAVVGPILLGTVGVGLLALDVAAALNTGCQRRDSTGACLERRSIDEVPALLIGGAGVLALTGAFLWHMLDVDPGPANEDTALRVSPTIGRAAGGVSVAGRF